VVLEREVGHHRVLAERDARRDLDDVGVDVLTAERLRDRHAVVPVADEVQVADLVERDRRERLAAALGGGDPLPAAAQAGRRRAQAAVEVDGAVDAPDDLLQRYHLQPEVVLARAPERLHDLLERKHERDVVGLAPKPAADVREKARPAGAGEVGLGV
jgi:hypothetical protein